ncbi:hypothetical protein TrLO_g3243 [Triparma laevis f. longispina]|uniref:Uncharacterized protein n=1 Tax=Triparma laevis f. longispina TaxID=1714387 RepID=A0A9W7A5K7_9STRA|nr:hypothetical protein TrLO_g3243 [Triparma laevis f. longispina]
MLCSWTFKKIVFEAVPNHIKKKHALSTEQILTLKMAKSELLEYVCNLTTMITGVQLLAFFGTEGKLKSTGIETQYLLLVTIFGVVSSSVGTLSKLWIVFKETNQPENTLPNQTLNKQPEVTCITEVHGFWVFLGVLSTFGCSVLSVLTYTGDFFITQKWVLDWEGYFGGINTVTLPFVGVGMIVGVLAKPKRTNHTTPLKIWVALFVLGNQGANIVLGYGRGGTSLSFIYSICELLMCYLPFIYVLFDIRKRLSLLEEHDLSDFLINSLSMAKDIIAPMLFIFLRSNNCYIEEGNNHNSMCRGTYDIGASISFYIVGFLVIRLIHNSIPRIWRADLSLTIEKIATLDMTFRQLLHGVAAGLTGLCGLYLFAMMNTGVRIDEHEDSALQTQLAITAGVGLVSMLSAIVSELLTTNKILKARNFRLKRGTTSSFGYEKALVVEIHQFYFWLVVVMILIYCGFYSVFTFTEGNYLFKVLGTLISPIVATGFLFTVYSQPKRTDANYMRRLYLIFFGFLVYTEILGAVGMIRSGGKQVFDGLFALALILFYFLIFRMMLYLRKTIASKPREELNYFLINTMILKASAVIGPMIFFSFETISCLLKLDDKKVIEDAYGNTWDYNDYRNSKSLKKDHATGFYNDAMHGIINGTIVTTQSRAAQLMDPYNDCSSTAFASLYLSAFFVIFYVTSITSNSAPLHIQRASALSLVRVAKFSMSKRRRLEAILLIITSMSGLFLLSALGNEGPASIYIDAVGAVGLGCACIMAFLEMTNLRRMVKVSVITAEVNEGLGLEEEKRRWPRTLSDIDKNFSESKRFSAVKIAEGMTVGAVL